MKVMLTIIVILCLLLVAFILVDSGTLDLSCQDCEPTITPVNYPTLEPIIEDGLILFVTEQAPNGGD